MSTLPALLRLPLELRHQIYTHLLPPCPTSHPIPSVGITSVSHPLPSPTLLAIHPQLAFEILDFYHSLATWKLIFSHAFNFFRVDPQLTNLERSHVLGRMKNVEVVFYCDVLLVSDDLRGGTGGGRPGRMLTLQEEVRRKAKRAVEVLLQAKELRMVTVSWIDAGEPGKDGEAINRARVLIPLRELRDKVAFRVGRVTSSTVSVRQGESRDECDERAAFAATLAVVLYGDLESDLQRKDVELDGTSDSDLSRLRLLAFDPRQDRDRYHDRNPPAPTPVTVENAIRCIALGGSSGWETRYFRERTGYEG